MKIGAALLSLVLAAPCLSGPVHAADTARWNPEKWTAQDTLQFRTECPDEGEYWSPVWLVVLDNDVWVRLGTRAAGRVDCSKTRPFTSVRIAGEEFADIEMVPVPEMTDRVAAAMGEKYSTDIFVRFFSHPYTMKLVPKDE